MAPTETTDERVQRQLDRLDDPSLTEDEIKSIKDKIEVIQNSGK